MYVQYATSAAAAPTAQPRVQEMQGRTGVAGRSLLLHSSLTFRNKRFQPINDRTKQVMYTYSWHTETGHRRALATPPPAAAPSAAPSPALRLAGGHLFFCSVPAGTRRRAAGERIYTCTPVHIYICWVRRLRLVRIADTVSMSMFVGVRVCVHAPSVMSRKHTGHIVWLAWLRHARFRRRR